MNRIQADLRAGIRAAGLLAAAPWAIVVSFFLFAAPALTLVAVALPKALPILAVALAWLALAIGIVLVGFLGLSGHVTQPLGRVLGGVTAGLAAAALVSVASCAGIGGGLGWIPLAVGVAASMAAAPAAAAWARLRYDADRVGATIAALWALLLGGVPVLLYAAARLVG